MNRIVPIAALTLVLISVTRPLAAQTPATSAAAIPMEMQQTPSILLPGYYLDSERAPLQIGSLAPDFQLPLSRFSRFQTPLKTPPKLDFARWQASRKSRGTIVIFWAFWCDTWKGVTRDLNLLRPQIEPMNLQTLCVAVDASQQPVARRAFESGEISWPVVIDAQSTLSARWGVRRVPTLFVLDSDAIVRRVFEGFPGRQTFVRGVQSALKLPASAALPARRRG